MKMRVLPLSISYLPAISSMRVLLVKGFLGREKCGNIKMISNDGARGLDTMCAPNGKNYIAHDDIPPEVQAAFERLQAVYGTQTRAANPLYASK